MLTLKRPPPHPLGAADRMDLDPPPPAPDPRPSHAGRADARGLDRIGVETAMRNGLLPLEPMGAVTPVAGADRRDFRRLQAHLKARLGPVAFRRKSADVIEAEILRLRAPYLARRAEERTPTEESCRSWSRLRGGLRLGSLLVLGLTLSLAMPTLFFGLISLWAAVTLIGLTALRSLGALTALRRAQHTRRWVSQRGARMARSDLPVVSVLVPLFDELDIAGRLDERLSRLDYPRDKLEVCLVLENGDLRTEAALRQAKLPDWMRIVHVPAGPVRTKPRAMNYALDFTRGDIIGIYDAEDRPAPDQLRKVALAFHRARPELACLQGVLDFYNAGDTWLTRCFTIDYAAWFRLVLPGLARLGFVIPLGGTTVFFRRKALEDLGRWDAHNVTEDADLGIRLARHGFRCDFMPSLTEEEATSRVWPWIRQRSRWIKGYMLTWAVHMRQPLGLLRDLGLKRFLGVQILFFGTLSHFLLAPFLWSFWLILLGLPHPVETLFSQAAIVTIATLFFASEILTLLAAGCAVATPRHGWLIKWVPVMHLYYPLAAFASWKAFAELLWKPFFWDKTAHGKARVTRTWARRFWPPLPRRGATAPRTPG